MKYTSIVNNRQLENDAIKIFTGRHKIHLISPINNTVTQRRSFTPLVWHYSHRECYQSGYTQNSNFWTCSLQKFWKSSLWKSAQLYTIEGRNWPTDFDVNWHCIFTLGHFDFFQYWNSFTNQADDTQSLNYVLMSQPLTRAVYTSQNSWIPIRERPVKWPRYGR